MKKSELKEMIKAAMMEETTGAAIEAEEYDPVMEAEGDEATDAEAADAEATDAETTDVAVDDTEVVDTTTTTEIDPNVKAVQDALTQAIEAAKTLGDKKLEDQIGNTITFFTRTHVVGKEAVAEDLSMYRMLRIAGLNNVNK